MNITFARNIILSIMHLSVVLSANAEECLDYANLKNKDNSLFVGYGKANTLEDATDVARNDIAKQLRTTVSSHSSVTDTENESHTFLNIQSRAKEDFRLLRVDKRCEEAGQFAAVLTLSKSNLESDLIKKIRPLQQQIETLHVGIKQANTPMAQLTSAATGSRFFKKYFAQFDSDLSLCVAVGGCRDIQRETWIDTQRLDDETLRSLKIHFNPRDDDALNAVASILRNEGFTTTLGDSTLNLIVQCKKQNLAPAKELFVAEEICNVNISTKTKREFFWATYAAKGVGLTLEAARTNALRRLKRVTSDN